MGRMENGKCPAMSCHSNHRKQESNGRERKGRVAEAGIWEKLPTLFCVVLLLKVFHGK